MPASILEWPSNGVRRASINNLRIGGTNAHAILEQAYQSYGRVQRLNTSNEVKSDGENTEVNGSSISSDAVHFLFVLTANVKTTVRSQMSALKLYLDKKHGYWTQKDMSNLAFTLCQRRSLLVWRIGLAASTAECLAAQLESTLIAPSRATKQPKLGFVFTGQGANWYGMGRELFQAYPVFSSTITMAEKHLASLGAQWSLIGLCSLQPFGLPC